VPLWIATCITAGRLWITPFCGLKACGSQIQATLLIHKTKLWTGRRHCGRPHPENSCRSHGLAYGMRPPDVAVGVVHVHDSPLQGPADDQPAGRLNLGKLWHPPFCDPADLAHQ
jgi:hypothetical protein